MLFAVCWGGSSVSISMAVATALAASCRLASTFASERRSTTPYSATDTAVSETAKTAAYQNARRARIDSPNARIRLGAVSQTIARAPVRVDQRLLGAVIDLAAQAIDVDLERIGERI